MIETVLHLCLFLLTNLFSLNILKTWSFQVIFKSTLGILKAFQFLEEVLLSPRNVSAIPAPAPTVATPPAIEVNRKGDISNLVKIPLKKKVVRLQKYFIQLFFSFNILLWKFQAFNKNKSCLNPKIFFPQFFHSWKLQAAIKRSLFKRALESLGENATESSLFGDVIESRLADKLFDSNDSRSDAFEDSNNEEGDDDEEGLHEDYSAEEISIANQIVRKTIFVSL